MFTRCPSSTSKGFSLLMKIFPCAPPVHSKLWFLTTVPCYCLAPLRRVCFQVVGSTQLLTFQADALSHLLSQFHKLFIAHNLGSFLTFQFFYILSDLEAQKEVLSSQRSESWQSLRCNTALHFRFSYTTFLLLPGQREFYSFTRTPSNY